MPKKIKWYDVVLIDKYGNEHFYMRDTFAQVMELLSFAIDHNQTIKYIKGRVR